VLYENLEATDAETDRVVFRCSRLEVEQAKVRDSEEQSRSTLIVTASQPEMTAESFPQAWRRLERILEGGCGRMDANVRFLASELTLRSAVHAQTLADVKGVLEDLSVGMLAQCDFHLAGDKPENVARIRAVRNRQTSPPITGFELDCGDAWLPGELFEMAFAGWQSLGPRSRFHGYFHGDCAPDGLRGEMFGQWADLDLSRLVGDHFPYRCGFPVEGLKVAMPSSQQGPALSIAR
jgi:hypothetical protein